LEGRMVRLGGEPGEGLRPSAHWCPPLLSCPPSSPENDERPVPFHQGRGVRPRGTTLLGRPSRDGPLEAPQTEPSAVTGGPVRASLARGVARGTVRAAARGGCSEARGRRARTVSRLAGARGPSYSFPSSPFGPIVAAGGPSRPALLPSPDSPWRP